MAAGALRPVREPRPPGGARGSAGRPAPPTCAPPPRSARDDREPRVGAQRCSPALASRARHRRPRGAGIHALGASEDPRAIDGLVRALADTVPRLRESAAQMLGMLGDERAVGAAHRGDARQRSRGAAHRRLGARRAAAEPLAVDRPSFAGAPAHPTARPVRVGSGAKNSALARSADARRQHDGTEAVAVAAVAAAVAVAATLAQRSTAPDARLQPLRATGDTVPALRRRFADPPRRLRALGPGRRLDGARLLPAQRRRRRRSDRRDVPQRLHRAVGVRALRADRASSARGP